VKSPSLTKSPTNLAVPIEEEAHEKEEVVDVEPPARIEMEFGAGSIGAA